MGAIELRPYQVRFVNAAHDALRRSRSVLVTAPTGAGKRVILVWWCSLGVSKGRRVLFVTDRQILVRQMANECAEKGVNYGIIMGSEPTNADAMVQIASIQTLTRREWTGMPRSNLVLVDEAHKATAAYAELFKRLPDAKHVGVTATPVGASGTSLVPEPFDELVEVVKNSELIKDGYLLSTECWCPSEPDMKGVSIQGGQEYNQSELSKRVKECVVYADVFQWWEPYSQMQTIAFVPGVDFAYGVAEQFKQRGFTAEVIEANTKKNERAERFERFNSRELRVLISVDVLREGFDSPAAQCGIDMQPNNQLRTYWQKVGRVRRPHPGQTKAIWLDFAGNFWKFPHPDEDPEWSKVTTDESIQDVIRKSREENGEGAKPWSCPNCAYTLAPWERIHSGACPNCGRKIGKPVRRIRMLDGEMKCVGAESRKKKKASTDQAMWDSCRYKAFYTNRTLDFARYLFKKQTGKWPYKELKCCPGTWDSLDWKRQVREVYPWMGTKRRG